MLKESNINLEEISYLQFDKKDSKLKETIRKDISKFKLTLAVEEGDNGKIGVYKQNSNSSFILDCEQIFRFEFPEGSKIPITEAKSPRYDHHVGIKMTFNYNDKHYEIHGFI